MFGNSQQNRLLSRLLHCAEILMGIPNATVILDRPQTEIDTRHCVQTTLSDLADRSPGQPGLPPEEEPALVLSIPYLSFTGLP